MTFNYGKEHNLYLGGREIGLPAKLMYAGALMWLVIFSIALIKLMRTALRMKRLSEFGGPDQPRWQEAKTTLEIAKMMAGLDGWYTKLNKKPTHHSPHQVLSSERTPLTRRQNEECTPNNAVYGTFSDQENHRQLCQSVLYSEFYAIMVLSMFLLWISQWLFWGGFIFLISDELVTITAVWVAFSFLSTIAGLRQ
ncbi:uncharacterized protein N7483_004308 [Penicillium malachiteum]|uniref:uncharacterized protein n=1 Tax=Penicillium malachiteum TaxID=1324776 RepID=UPI00254956AD|nr:uncharacterized protein N7483_004308 [Penicillium malachiteum]KAJ5729800.1 hypothetical protein N7483_004308 [Penicillium malachiteum]